MAKRNPVFFSLGVDFSRLWRYAAGGTAKVFRSSVAAELAPTVSPLGLRQLRHPDTVPLSGDVGIPSLLKLLRLKSTLATKNNRIPFIDSKYIELDIPSERIKF